MSLSQAIAALRMERQFLSAPAGAEEYPQLFRRMSPVPPLYWCEPGSPPTLPMHAGFDDGRANDALRAQRELLKGRFGGLLSYVFRKDWELFCCLYRKPLRAMDAKQRLILELLEREGPMNIALIKEFTGMLVKEITPALHKLQEACLVFEDQTDKEGDRAWCLFSGEFPDVDLERYTKEEALAEAVTRFSYLSVFFTASMVKSFYRVPMALVKRTLAMLEERGELLAKEIDGVNGFISKEDVLLLTQGADREPPEGILLLQRNDFWARANADSLKARFSSPWDTLYYLLIDGELGGSVEGKFKFGPAVVEDVLLDLSPKEAAKRKAEVLLAMEGWLDPKESPLARYCSVEEPGYIKG